MATLKSLESILTKLEFINDVLIGTPAGDSLSADVSTLDTVVDAAQTEIGTAVNASIAADLAALLAVID